MGRFSEHTLGFIIIELHSLPPCYGCRITLRQFTTQSQVSVQRQLWDRTGDSHHGCCVMMSSCQHGALRNVSSTSTSVPNKVAVSVYRYSSGGQKWKHKPWMTEGVAGGALWLHHWCGRSHLQIKDEVCVLQPQRFVCRREKKLEYQLMLARLSAQIQQRHADTQNIISAQDVQSESSNVL